MRKNSLFVTFLLMIFLIGAGCNSVSVRETQTLPGSTNTAEGDLNTPTDTPAPTLSPADPTDDAPVSTPEATAVPENIPTEDAFNSLVYTDALVEGVQNWSWGAEIDLGNAAPAHNGSASIAVTINGAEWGGLYLAIENALQSNTITGVSFWIHGGSEGGQALLAKLIDGNNGNWDPSITINPEANTWTEVTVRLAEVGNPASVSGLVIQDDTGGSQPTFYVDDITLIRRTNSEPLETPVPIAGPSLNVDVNANRHPISPYIYGMNFAEEALAQTLQLPVRRRGGNHTTRYNWQLDVYNTGSDWYFENIAEENPNPERLPDGSDADRFVEQDQRTGTKTILTIPLIGWTAKQRLENHPFDCGFKVSLYGPQQSVDPYDEDCGNGVDPNGNPITGNDPTDTSLPTTPAFVQGWINHLIGNYGTAADGGVMFYNLDNEPMLWPFTHTDIHPELTTFDEIRDRTYEYAAAIKAADPGAQTLGPVVWGWCAYFYSAADECSPSGADYQSHGEVYFVEWYLQQMAAYEQQNGVRILDYLDLHIYPQTSNVFSGELGDAEVQAARLRSTRQLWDRTYVTEDWIDQPLYLIPQMHEWVDNNYPGTKIAITEYSWGAMGYLNGALAQADILGIFGREGLDLATLWASPSADQPGAYAFRMYLNYDGQGGQFGETSVQAASTDQEQLAIYAAQRDGDEALTLMVINKTNSALISPIAISNFTPASSATVYRYSAENLNAIVLQPDQVISSQGFTATFPASSITFFVIPAGK